MSILSASQVRALRGDGKRREYHLGDGLYVIVQPKGAKSFALRYRRGGKPVKHTLGLYFDGEARDAPVPKVGAYLTLVGAQKLASDARIEIQKGNDPATAKKEANEAKRVADENTFETVALKYLRRECGMRDDGTFDGRKRSAANSHAALQRLVFPEIGKRPISHIKRLDVIKLLDKIEDERGPVMADRTLAIIRTIMGWYALRDEDFRSPLVRGMARTKWADRARDRVLSDDELRAVWKASDSSDPFAALIRFLLLTGARRTEAAAMTWDEIKDGVWTLPRERNKTGKALERPLSEAAMVVLPPKIEGCRYVFTWDGLRPITGYSKPKARFDEAAGVSDWRLHDLRRTARSLMSRAEVPSDHAERCLGHIIAGVRGVYDRHKYLAQMMRAYELLARQIELIVNPPADNVLPFQKAGDE